MASSAPLPTGWLKVWIGFGVLGILLITATTWRVLQTRNIEFDRYQRCVAGRETSCDPSVFWLLAGFELSPDMLARLSQGGNPNAAPQTGKRLVKTVETAPTIYSVRPDGMMVDGVGYRVKPNAKVTFTVTSDPAKQVSIWFAPVGASSTRVGDLSRDPAGSAEDGSSDAMTFKGVLTWKGAAGGEMEIRAEGQENKGTSSLFIPISAEVAETP